MWKAIEESSNFIKEKVAFNPEIGIILGTGLGGLAEEIEVFTSVNYEDIPHFPVSTVEGHSGKLIFGHLGGKKVVAMKGRFHFYEGYNMKEVTFPVRVLKMLGIEKLFVSNASGGVNANFEVGDIMLINDHLNFFPEHPLRGKNDTRFGTRFPDMSEAYDKQMLAQARELAQKMDIKVQEGVYAGTTGPTFETPAEYKFYNIAGADAVGMSTVPEVIVARHMGIPVFGVSIITDLGVEGKIIEVSHEEVQVVAKKAETIMTKLIIELLKII